MSDRTQEELHVASKRHRCNWCGEFVEPGERYLRYRYFADGEAGTVREHPECYEAMMDAANAYGGWIEFSPGDNERPSRAVLAKIEGSES